MTNNNYDKVKNKHKSLTKLTNIKVIFINYYVIHPIKIS